MQTLVRSFARFTALVSAVLFPIAIILQVVYALLIRYLPELKSETSSVFELAPVVTAVLAALSCIAMQIFLVKTADTAWKMAAFKGLNRGCLWLLIGSAICIIPTFVFVSYFWNDFQWGLKTYKAVTLADHKEFGQALQELNEARKSSSGNALAAIDILEARFLSDQDKSKEATALLENTMKRLKETEGNDLVMLAITDGALTRYYEQDDQLEKAEKSELECVDYIQKARQSGKFETFFNGLGRLFNQVPLPALNQQKLRLMGIYMDEGKFDQADKLAAEMLAQGEQEDFGQEDMAGLEKRRSEIKSKLGESKSATDEAVKDDSAKDDGAKDN